MADLCLQIASHVLQPRPAPGGSDAAQTLHVLLADTLACVIAGSQHPATVRLLARDPGPGPALSLANGARMSRLGAILQTGTAIRALDYNDFFWGPGMGGHPSDIFATALVLAEEGNATLGEMLVAVDLGYRLYVELLDLMSAENPFDHTTAATLASVAIAGRLLRLSTEELAEAVAMAIARGPALALLRRGAISQVKAASAALACMNGVLAAELAQVGLTGPRSSVEDRQGLPAILREGVHPSDLLGALAGPSALGRVQIKRYPCIGTAQAAAAAAIALKDAVGDSRAIVGLAGNIADNPVARHQTGEAYRHPETLETADHSFFSVIAMGLADGEVTLRGFHDRRWTLPEARRLAAMLRFSADLPGAREGLFPAELVAQLADGTELRIARQVAAGHPLAPIDMAGVLEKLRQCAAHVGRDAAVDPICAALGGMTDAMPVRTLLSHLSGIVRRNDLQ